MMTSSRLNAEYVTSHYDDDDQKSINDSSLSDAIADILDFYDDEAEKIPANNSFKKSLTSGQLKEPDIDVKYPISPNTDITDEVEETSYSDDASENGDGTPPMPDIYLSSESLSLKMPFESNNSARSDGYHYNDDFEDFDDSASTATDYNIPSICSSACPSTHDFSIDDDDDLLAMGHVDYWEDVTCNHVAQPAAEFNSATHVIKDQTATEAINDVDNYTPDDVVSKAIDTPVTEDISVADDNQLGHADYWEGVQPAYNATTHTIKDKATTEAAKDNHTPDVVSYSLDTPVTEDISVADDNQLGHADYWEDVQPAYNAATHAIKDQTATKDNQTPDVVSNSLDTPVTEDISIADEILLGLVKK
ncbi:uncharacterized protein [Antedon mediterranea]|uniref:uncharacterized protein n=1 Tax=Antedon mediterranea TaxID=105859 RepID=UPI003AF497BF